MFSGIVEAKSKIVNYVSRDQVVELHIARPTDFQDISLGDSVAVNGVCLTVEKSDSEHLTFAVANETLKVTQWNEEKLCKRPANLERSLRMGDRVHGHFVTGHVDEIGRINRSEKLGESLLLSIESKDSLSSYVWRKGSVALNGVSLTINEVVGNIMEFCLIPETLKRTNLGDFKVGDFVNIEVDFMARGLLRTLELKQQQEMES